MKYKAALVYSEEGSFVGYVIQTTGTRHLKGTNLYGQDELDEFKKALNELNEADLLRQFWPLPNDPEVQEIVLGLPVEYQEAEVLDESQSSIVWRYDEMTDMNVINEPESTLVYKTMEVPIPGNIIDQLDKACEVIARQRAGL